MNLALKFSSKQIQRKQNLKIKSQCVLCLLPHPIAFQSQSLNLYMFLSLCVVDCCSLSLYINWNCKVKNSKKLGRQVEDETTKRIPILSSSSSIMAPNKLNPPVILFISFDPKLHLANCFSLLINLDFNCICFQGFYVCWNFCSWNFGA